MIQQGFYLTKKIPSRWWVMTYYDIKTDDDLQRVFGALLASGVTTEDANNAIQELSNDNSGYIHSDLNKHSSIICISHGSTFDEVFNTVTHEIKHLTEHICSAFDIDPKSEHAAYIQGELGKEMYKAVALLICPKCHGDKH